MFHQGANIMNEQQEKDQKTNAIIQALQSQRNGGQDQIASLSAELHIAQTKLQMAEAKVKELEEAAAKPTKSTKSPVSAVK